MNGLRAMLDDPPPAARVSTVARVGLVTMAMTGVLVVATVGCALMWAVTR